MATFKSDLTAKLIRQRGLYDGKVQSVSGSLRLNPGTTITSADVIQAVPLGENVRPTRIQIAVKEVSGTPTVSGTLTTGVAPQLAVDLVRPDGVAFPPLAAAATLYGTGVNVGTTAVTHLSPAIAPTTNTKWGPYFLTLTPSANLSVTGGSVDIVVTVEYNGEHQEANPIYSEFNSQKYKN